MEVADSLSRIVRINGKYVQTVHSELAELLERADSLSLFVRNSRIADSLSLIMRINGKYTQQKKKRTTTRFPLRAPFNTKVLIVMKYSFLIKSI